MTPSLLPAESPPSSCTGGRPGSPITDTAASGPRAGILHVSFLVLLTLLVLPWGLAAQDRAADGEGGPAAASTSPPTARVARVADEPPRVDGRLEDPAWASAEALTGFTQRTPRDGEPATQRTEVRVTQDDDALYVGVWAYDQNPDGIVEGERIRDTNLGESDAVLLIFDTYSDEQNGFVFGTNPAGIQYDGQVANQGEGGGRFSGGPGQNRQQAGSGGGFNLNWDASWTVATFRDTEGWYAEFRIPFSTLRYGAGEEQAWGFNVSRRVRRTNEESFWASVPREFNLYRLSEAGTLAGLEPPARRSVQVTPYVLGSTSRNYAAGQGAFDEEGEVGGDAKVQVTQGLTLDLTYNTDFAQVEVDDVQTNLTRFSLFFPEKRPFFLENAGFFSVGTGSAELFFSRRIGIAPGGTQVPIEGGGRLSGRAAGLNVGLLHIRTEGLEGVQPGNAFSVARVAKELPNRSNIGAIFVGRDGLGDPSSGVGTGDDDYNRTYAVDGQLGIGEALTVSSFLARTETPGLDGRDHTFHGDASWQSRDWMVNGNYREVGEDFNPEVGFLPRSGYRTYSAFAMRFFRPQAFLGLREIRPHVRYQTYRDLETGFEETANLHVDSHFEWHGGSLFSPVFNWNREGLEQPFAIPGTDVVVPPGTYDGWEAAWRYNTDPSADLSFGGGFEWGSFLSGNRRGTSGTLTLRSGSALSTSLRFEYNDVNLAEGDFITRLAGLRVGYFFTPSVYLQSLVQYADQSNNWSANVRFGWLHTAGTGLFVVYNESQGVDSLDGPLNRSLILKYSRQFTVWGG